MLNRDRCVRLICSTWTVTLYHWAALLGEACCCSKTYKATELEIWLKLTTDVHKMQSLHPSECFVHLLSPPAGLCHVCSGWDGHFWNAMWSLSAIIQREGDICWLAASKFALYKHFQMHICNWVEQRESIGPGTCRNGSLIWFLHYKLWGQSVPMINVQKLVWQELER